MATVLTSNLRLEVSSECFEFINKKLRENGDDMNSIVVDALESWCESRPKNIKASGYVDKLFSSIFEYNDSCSSIYDKIYPTYSMIDKLYFLITGRRLAKKTYDDIYATFEPDVLNNLKDIPPHKLGTWNNTHHRKTFDTVSKKVIALFN